MRYEVSVVIWVCDTAETDHRMGVPLTKVLIAGAIGKKTLDVLMDRVKEWLATTSQS
jgi:hypothetical protein